MAHHNMIDTSSEYFFINVNTRGVVYRNIKGEVVGPPKMVQTDHQSAVYTFKMDRYIENHDMLNCADGSLGSVEVHYINAGETREKVGFDYVTDLRIDETDSTENTLTFSWSPTNGATELEGAIYFLIKFKCFENISDGLKTIYVFNTDVYGNEYPLLVNYGFNNTNTKNEDVDVDLLKSKVNLMHIIDAKRIEVYKEYPEYRFSEYLWDRFINNCNRVYVERSRNRGTYGMYALSYDASPIYNAWINMTDWDKQWEEGGIYHGQEYFLPREGRPEENGICDYPKLDSVVQRNNNGQITVPKEPISNSDAVSKQYVDTKTGTALEKAESVEFMVQELWNQYYAGTEGLQYQLSTDGTYYICTGATFEQIPDNSDITVAAYIEGIEVKQLAPELFSGRIVPTLTIPHTISILTGEVFKGAQGLTTVYIGDLKNWCSIKMDTYQSNPFKTTQNLYFNKKKVQDILTIPNGVVTINKRAFQKSGVFTGLILPEGLIDIGHLAFSSCPNLAGEITLPSTLNSMDTKVFESDTKLTSIRFLGTPSGTINSNAFYGCTGVTDIYVPWAEGAVSGAPWGATNATIHYNYTE